MRRLLILSDIVIVVNIKTHIFPGYIKIFLCYIFKLSAVEGADMVVDVLLQIHVNASLATPERIAKKVNLLTLMQ